MKGDWLQTTSDLWYELELSYSVLQGEAVFKHIWSSWQRFWWSELGSLRPISHNHGYVILLRTIHRLFDCILPQGQPVGRMLSWLQSGHVHLGVNFMSWSNFCVLVWFSSPWRDFITLSDIIRICGHVMTYVITLWWAREFWCDFFSILDEIFVLVWFCLSWCHFTPWWNQPNLGMIFLRFEYNFRFSQILFILESLDVLVWLAASWYDFPLLGFFV